MQEKAYLAWLRTGDTIAKTHENQLSRVRRLEIAFGDLDAAFEKDGMASLLRALAPGSVLPAGIVSDGDHKKTLETLRHAARKYRTFKREAPTSTPPRLPLDLAPIHPPKSAAPSRWLQPTGYWMFAASPDTWDSNGWRAAEEDRLLYTVSPGDAGLIQPGDLAVIKRNVWRSQPSQIVALVEVLTPPAMRTDPDARFFRRPADARTQAWRVELAVLAVPDPPIEIRAMLPEGSDYVYLRNGIQRTTAPIPRVAFERIASLAGLTASDVLALRGSRSIATLDQVQAAAAKLTPQARERVSSYIERGPIGEKVKAARHYRCQVCEALGREPVAFLKAGGGGYAEAHHVMPVAWLLKGSLAANNIMVLCPNHHRQAHYGLFEVAPNDAASWTVTIDGVVLQIERTEL